MLAKEAVVADFKVFSWNLPRRTENIYGSSDVPTSNPPTVVAVWTNLRGSPVLFLDVLYE